MKYVDIMLGPYLPDLGGSPNPQVPGYLVQVDGVHPVPAGLKAIPVFLDLTSTTAVTGTTYGRIHAVEVGSTIAIFACTSTSGPTNTRFHQTNNSGVSWSDVEGPSGAPGLWPDFCQFDDLIIAVSLARVPQSKTLTAAVGTAFADLAGSPPTGATIARVRDHVVIGNLSTDPYSVQWGAIGDPETWPTPGTADARSKQAGTQALPIELGKITKVVGGEKFGLIFQQRGITRMTYVGGSAVFEFDTFERRAGTGYADSDTADVVMIPHPVVDTGGLFVWPNSISGLYVTDGYSIRKVSLGKFDSYFSIGTTPWWSSAYDARRRCAVFVSNNPGAYLSYAPETDQASFGNDSSVASICSYPSAANPGLLNLSQSFKLQIQNSATQQTLRVQTGCIEPEPGYRVQLTGATLLGPSTSGLTLEYKSVATQSDCDTSTSGITSMTAASRGDSRTARADAPYFAFRITGAGNSSQLLRGIRMFYEKSSQL